MSSFEEDSKDTVSYVESEENSLTSACKYETALGNSASISCSGTEVLNGEGKEGEITNQTKKFTENSDIPLETKGSSENNNYAVPSNAPNWNDVCGLASVKSELEMFLILPKKFVYKNVNLPKSFLLYGVTGTGKTSIAFAIAKVMTVSCFIQITPTDISSRFFGEREKKLSEKFKWANNNSPSVIFIDDIDFFASTSCSRGLKTRLLMEMKEMNPEVTLIAATRWPHYLDSAIVRGFDKLLHLGLPDFQQRVDTFKKNLRYAKNLTAENFVMFASRTVGYTSADIERISTVVTHSALDRNRGKLHNLKCWAEKNSKIFCKDCELIITEDDVLFAISGKFVDEEELNEITRFARARGDILVEPREPRPQFELEDRCLFCKFLAFICCWAE